MNKKTDGDCLIAGPVMTATEVIDRRAEFSKNQRDKYADKSSPVLADELNKSIEELYRNVLD